MTTEASNDSSGAPHDRHGATTARRQHRFGAVDRRRDRRRRGRVHDARPRPGAALYRRLAGAVGDGRAVHAVRLRRRYRALRRPRRRRSDHAADGRSRLRRPRGHRPERPCGLRQPQLSQPHRRHHDPGRASGRAGVHRQSRRLRSGVSAAQGVARGQAPYRGGARRRLRRRAGPLAADAGPAARARQAAVQIHGVVARRHHPRSRTPGGRVPGTAARHRVSRPRAGRVLLGQCRGRPGLCQRHAGGLARPRPRRDRLGRAEAQRHHVGRRRGALDLDCRGAGRGQDRGVRSRFADAQRQDHAGAAVPQTRLRRRRQARRVADAGDQPGAR